MPRQKGSLTFEQKLRMQAGRKAAKVKASNGIIPGQENITKSKKVELIIIGYGMDKGDKIPYPIFASEKNSYVGKIFASTKEAKEYRK